MWDRSDVVGWLEEALERSGGTHTVEDVYKEVQDGRAQIWTGAKSVVVTVLHDLPQVRIFRVWLAGGDLGEILQHLGLADELARSWGCGRIEIEGRKGWSRVLTGYREVGVILRKDV